MISDSTTATPFNLSLVNTLAMPVAPSLPFTGLALRSSATASITDAVTVLVLLPGTGSISVPLIVAVLVKLPVALTVATILSMALAPLARLPTFQFGAVHVPIDGVTLTTE